MATRTSWSSRLWDLIVYHIPMLLKTEAVRRFPRTYSVVPMRPVMAGLNITDNCNMRCVMCNSWREPSFDELKLESWKDILRQLRGQGIKLVGFAGGEPLLRKDLPELVAYATSLGLRTELTTSGYLLDDAKARALVEAGLGSVVVSIDGTGAAYEKIRGRAWERVERACELLAALNATARLRAFIGFVLMKPTLETLPAVQALSERLGLPLVISLIDYSPYLFQLPENTTTMWIRDREDLAKLRKVQWGLVERRRSNGALVANSYSEIDYFRRYFEDPLQPGLPCAVSQSRILIDSHGKVFGGCWSMGSYGDLQKQPLEEILRSDSYREAHRKMFFKDCPGCSCGYRTTLRYSLPTQLKEVGFRLSRRLRDRVAAP